jgi:Tol biopolymer transport system component
LFFVRDGTLMAQAFDATALRVTGDPIPVVQQMGIGRSPHFSATAGVMAYRTGPRDKSQLTWLDHEGKIIDDVGEPGLLVSISLSPSEKQLAIVRSEKGSQQAGDISLLDLARNVETRLTTGQKVRVRGIYGPVWSPDGERLAFASGTGIYVKDASGAADAKLVKDLGHPVYVTDWTHDGKYLLYDDLAGTGDVRQVPADGGEPALAVVTEAEEARSRISPHGQ